MRRLLNKGLSNVVDNIIDAISSRLEQSQRLLHKTQNGSSRSYRDWAYLPLADGQHAVLTHSLSGERVFLDPRDPYLTVHFLEAGIWEPQVSNAFRETFSAGSVFFDVGANVGLHSLSASRIGYEVHAFEPEPDTYKFLEINVRINALPVKVVNFGLSDNAGSLTFAKDSHSSGMSGLVKSLGGVGRFDHSNEDNPRYKYIKVDVITLDDYVQENIGFDSLKNRNIVLKIDAEGHEGEVLLGAKKTLRSADSFALVIELHLDNHKLVETLEKFVQEFHTVGRTVSIKLLVFEATPIELNVFDANDWLRHGSGDVLFEIS